MPTEHVDSLQLDLNRLFDVGRPGAYRLSLKLASGKNGAWQENEVVFTVTEKSGKGTSLEASSTFVRHCQWTT